MTETDLHARALALLRRFYGYTRFRPMQMEVIEHVMSGRDCLVLMPTGGGKSICYQIPALMLPGCAIVVSPLIALMDDQVTALRANGIPAAAIHSNQREADNRRIIDELYAGHIKLLYTSPERILSEIDRWSKEINISLIAIDEAHCISRWGHDFRPDYTRLARLKDTYPGIPVMALTATADRLTRSDIGEQLRLTEPRLFITSFDRPNISIKVFPGADKSYRIGAICRLIDKYSLDSGIVYCQTRAEAERIADRLLLNGYSAVAYHAGMAASRRSEAQRRFINGEVQAVCATIAFGMGIDKSNIRWVVHNNLPPNIESYYQEIGRAGRDGMPAETILFHNVSDLITLRQFALESGQQEINFEKLSRMTEFAESKVCRRRILLSYFGEQTDHDCGNCDVCLSPPKRFDGLTIAQKALSAVVRMEGRCGMTTLNDVLRGMMRPDIIAHGFHRIKTFGAGRDLSASEWRYYLTQLVQLGMLEIAYEDSNHLRISPYGMSVLRSKAPLMLAQYEGAAPPRRRVKVREQIIDPQEQLLVELKKKRQQIAKREGIAPYMVLSDTVLSAIAIEKPIDMDTFEAIEGISQFKLVKYWLPFVKIVRKSRGLPALTEDDSSESVTLALLNKGYSVEKIASLKEIRPSTVYIHIARLIRSDRFSDFPLVITREQYLDIMTIYRANPSAASGSSDANSDTPFARYPRGLVSVALAIADYLLRHRTE